MIADIVEGLRKLRSQEQGVHGYAPSSRWYTGTTLAISWLEQGLNATSPAERFRYAWSAIYNLYMMTHARGDIENTTMTSWAAEIQDAPKVRQVATAIPDEFLPALLKAKNALLYDAEKKKPREALAVVNTWQQKRARGRDVQLDKACVYLILIGRDIRNALSHPTLDVNSANIKKALKLAADIFIPLATVAIEATIERPPAGTTGRATPYRSFLYPFLKNSDSVFSDYYLERLFPEEELGAFPEEESRQRLKELTKAHQTCRAALSRADTETTLRDWCEPSLFAELGLAAHSGVRIITDGGIFEPTRVIARADVKGNPRAEYMGKEAGRELACLVWVFPWGASLDAVSRDEAFPELTLMEVVQRALARADVEWAILTNGQRLRLLSKRTAHKVRSFLEVDLAAIIDRWTDRDAQLAFRYTLGLFSQGSLTERDEHDRTRLDRVVQKSEQHGKEISDELKKNVFDALEELGQGFLDYLRSNPLEAEAWRVRRAPSVRASEFLASYELLTDVYHESLSLMYRLLFLFYAESRDLLPMENEAYRETYSLESIRDDIIATHDDPDPTRFFSRGATNLWDRLKELFSAVDRGWANVIPAYNGGLFDPEQHEFLEQFKVSDYHLARAIDLLSRTKPGAVRGEGRKKVTYRDLDIRHLGSIYEGILEYHAEIADQEKVVVKRGTGGKAAEEYVSIPELTADERKHLKAYQEALAEDEESPQLPRGCKVTGLIEPGEYYLIYGGRESKRKSSGSYYTPDYIVQYIVENTLGPLVRGECRPKSAPVPELLRGVKGLEEEVEEVRPLTSDEILELRVLDPAMGSGHFLVAATEYLARAYGAACVREGRDADGVMSDEEFVRYKRMVAERCIYGVDINPMAVELAKLSMWLFTMDRGRPLSFLNHHLKNGNALIGAWIRDLGAPPEFDDKGKPKKRQRKDTRTGNLFEVKFREKVPEMVSDLLGIMEKETLTISDVREKKTIDHSVEDLKRPFKNVADAFVSSYFGEAADDYNTLLLEVERARHRSSVAAEEHHFFHWELEFPELFFDGRGNGLGSNGGFTLIIGNPPYANLQTLDRNIKLNYLPNSPDWSAFYRGQADIHYFFIKRSLDLLSKNGLLSFITSRYWIEATYANTLRQQLLSDSAEIELVDLNNNTVFEDPSIHTSILSLRKSSLRNSLLYRAGRRGEMASDVLNDKNWVEVPFSSLSAAPWSFEHDETNSIKNKTNLLPRLAGEFRVGMGVSTGLNAAFIIDAADALSFESMAVRRLIKNSDIARYVVVPSTNRLIFTVDVSDIKTTPNVANHLSPFRRQLENRRGCHTEDRWYKFKEEQNYDMAEHYVERIITPYRGQFPRFAIAGRGWHGCTDTYSLVPHENSMWDVYGLLAILNSSVIRLWFQQYGKKKGEVIEFLTRPIQELPIPKHPVMHLSELGKDISQKAEELANTLSSDSSRLSSLFEQSFEQVRERYEELGGTKKAVRELCAELSLLERKVDHLVWNAYELLP
jgi:type I restriction-modification system DNA methylase subunit